ncbi:hypothetical protein H5410_044036 [Solanum commersonii]|uniref:Uncharacterized protein n=1 Tax=Solanum commersonii TaxID=4109 RepID=A0A9J5Y0L8_SOLCO|nr:hypothetical protein H5410_044036 [Solanum commersonii]
MGFTSSGDRLTWKMGRLNGCPRKISSKIRSEFQITKKFMDYIAHENRSPKSPRTIAHENQQNGGFTHEN